jgi:hypothetical protein
MSAIRVTSRVRENSRKYMDDIETLVDEDGDCLGVERLERNLRSRAGIATCSG